MARNSSFEYEVTEGQDSCIDQKGNSCLSLRMVSWGGNTPKLDLRRWFSDQNGDETCGKGFTFQTEEGPHELTEELVDREFGDTAKILMSLQNREDFDDSLEEVTGSDVRVKKEQSVVEIDEDKSEMYSAKNIFD